MFFGTHIDLFKEKQFQLFFSSILLFSMVLPRSGWVGGGRDFSSKMPRTMSNLQLEGLVLSCLGLLVGIKLQAVRAHRCPAGGRSLSFLSSFILPFFFLSLNSLVPFFFLFALFALLLCPLCLSFFSSCILPLFFLPSEREGNERV